MPKQDSTWEKKLQALGGLQFTARKEQNRPNPPKIRPNFGGISQYYTTFSKKERHSLSFSSLSFSLLSKK